MVDRTITESELIFHAVEQIQRGFKLLAAGEEAGLADDAAILKTIAIPLQRFVPNGEIIVPVEAALDLAPQARKQRPSYKQIRVPRRDI